MDLEEWFDQLNSDNKRKKPSKDKLLRESDWGDVLPSKTVPISGKPTDFFPSCQDVKENWDTKTNSDPIENNDYKDSYGLISN